MIRVDSRALALLAAHAHTIQCKVATADHPTDLHVQTGTGSIPRPRSRRLRPLSAETLDFYGGVFAGLVDVTRGREVQYLSESRGTVHNTHAGLRTVAAGQNAAGRFDGCGRRILDGRVCRLRLWFALPGHLRSSTLSRSRLRLCVSRRDIHRYVVARSIRS